MVARCDHADMDAVPAATDGDTVRAALEIETDFMRLAADESAIEVRIRGIAVAGPEANLHRVATAIDVDDCGLGCRLHVRTGGHSPVIALGQRRKTVAPVTECLREKRPDALAFAVGQPRHRRVDHRIGELADEPCRGRVEYRPLEVLQHSAVEAPSLECHPDDAGIAIAEDNDLWPVLAHEVVEEAIEPREGPIAVEGNRLPSPVALLAKPRPAPLD